MATLTSSSTYTEVEESYKDNASYFEDQSVAKARAYITACRFLIMLTPSLSRIGSAEIQKRTDLYRDEIKIAMQWLSANDTTRPNLGGVRDFDLGDFRS